MKKDHIISDELNHASIIDGCRLSRAKTHVFRHADRADAEAKLAALEGVPGRKLLNTKGVFSADGDIGPLPGLVSVAEKYGAIMMVDDAHSSGVFGGYVCGSKDFIDALCHRARPFLHPPAVTAACLAAFDILENVPGRIDALWSNTRYFQSELAGLGFPTVPEGHARIRTIVIATHTRPQLGRALEILSRTAISIDLL